MDAALDPKLMEVSIDISRSVARAELAVCTVVADTNETGFEDGTVCTVSKNARPLKVDQSGFEES